METSMHTELYFRMARLLESDCINYSVFLRVYSGGAPPGLPTAQAIAAILGAECIVSDVCNLDAGQMEAVLRNNLAYAGNAGAGPGTATLASLQFRQLLDAIIEDCRAKHARSRVAGSFTIADDGHPAYPVFWDFNLFFCDADSYTLVVGSSSD